MTTDPIERLREEWDKREIKEIKLSKKQIIVLELISKDFTTPQIAEILHLEHSTIRSHTRLIRQKLRVHSMPGAVSKAYQMGILTIGEK